MAQPIFPNERMVDVYKALELSGQVDVSDLDSEIQTEGVNQSFRDYDLYYSTPGTPGGEEYLIARPRTGKGVQFAMEYACGSHSWTANGQWDSATSDLIDPSQPVPGVNAPVVPAGSLGGVIGLPPPPGVFNPNANPNNPNFTRMTAPKQLQVDPELAKGVGVGARGNKVFDDALDAMLDATKD